jgi:AraC-like DNA-binding protein
MQYREIIPGNILKQYVKCYYIYESGSAVAFDDTVFPSGNMEIIFNLGSGQWQTAADDKFITTPAVELWGQIVKPLPVRSIGKNTMLGIRFYPHAAACFLNGQIGQFNNQVADLQHILGKQVRELHARLAEEASWNERIALVEEFLLDQLAAPGKKLNKMEVVNDIMKEIRREDFYENITGIASRYGITSRYLQKLFLQYTGLTPKLYTKINRFQNSLRLVSKKDRSLTSIAYDCGYFDQSHFIREFKYFTGYTPSVLAQDSPPCTLAFTVNHQKKSNNLNLPKRPEDAHATLAAAFNSGNVSTVLSMHDYNGIIVPEPGKPVSGPGLIGK